MTNGTDFQPSEMINKVLHTYEDDPKGPSFSWSKMTPEQKKNFLFSAGIGALIVVPTLFVLGFAFLPSTTRPRNTASLSLAASPAVTQSETSQVIEETPLLPSPSPFPSPTPSPSTTPSPSPSATPSPSPSPSASPTSTNANVDLSVEEIKIEDPETGATLSGPYYAGQRLSVRATLKNLGSQDSGVFGSYWTIDSSKVGVNNTGKVKANTTAVYDDVNSLVYSGFFLGQGSKTLTYVVDNENVLKEAKRDNNTKSLTVTVEATRSDLEAMEIVFFQPGTTTTITPTVGQAVTAKVKVKNNSQDKATKFSVKWSLNGTTVKESTFSEWLHSSETVTDTTGYDFTPAAGNTLKVEINTTSGFPETNTGNNSQTKTF